MQKAGAGRTAVTNLVSPGSDVIRRVDDALQISRTNAAVAHEARESHPQKMRGASRYLLVAALIIALGTGPLSLLWIHSRGIPEWIAQIKGYQTLIAILVTLFTAGLATAGVILNISAQRANLRDQLSAQHAILERQLAEQQRAQREQFGNAERRSRDERDEQRRVAAYDRFLERSQLASAFKGELIAILSILKDRLPKESLQLIIEDQLLNKKKTDNRIDAKVTTVFTANAGQIGKLSGDLPKLIGTFYAEFESFVEISNRRSSADWGAVPSEMIKLVIDDFEIRRTRVIDLALNLHKQLSAEMDAIFVWPPVTSTPLRPGQIASLAELLEKTQVDPLIAQQWIDEKLTPEEIASRAAQLRRKG